MVVERYVAVLHDNNSPDKIHQDLLAVAGDRLTVWAVYEPMAEAESQGYRRILNDHFSLCETAVDRPDFRVERYGLTAFGCLTRQPPERQLAQFDEGILLHDVKVIEDDAGNVRVATAWSVAGDVPPETYSVSLKVQSSRPDVFNQSDFGLRYPGFGWQVTTIPVNNLQPGDYTLTLTIYNWRTGERLAGTSRDTQGEVLPLVSLQLPIDSDVVAYHGGS
jgi:hypothetical protein